MLSFNTLGPGVINTPGIKLKETLAVPQNTGAVCSISHNSGKWYYESSVPIKHGDQSIGFFKPSGGNVELPTDRFQGVGVFVNYDRSITVFPDMPNLSGVTTSTTIFGVALDLDNLTFKLYLDGVLKYTAGIPSGTYYPFIFESGNISTPSTFETDMANLKYLPNGYSSYKSVFQQAQIVNFPVFNLLDNKRINSIIINQTVSAGTITSQTVLTSEKVLGTKNLYVSSINTHSIVNSLT